MIRRRERRGERPLRWAGVLALVGGLSLPVENRVWAAFAGPTRPVVDDPRAPSPPPEPKRESPAGRRPEPAERDRGPAAPESSAVSQDPGGSGGKTPARPDPRKEETSTGPAGAEKAPADPAGAPVPPPVQPRNLVPLPPPPPREPQSSLPRGPWYGNFWFEVRPDLTIPVGGRQPAKGELVSAGATVSLGYRPHRYVGLRTGMGLVLHDVRARQVETLLGDRVHVVDYGQILAFEFLGVRAFVPAHPRFLPYVEGASGLALWFPADGRAARSGGLVRWGVGFEGWVSPRVDLGLDLGYRMLWIGKALGHALQPSVHVGVHW